MTIERFERINAYDFQRVDVGDLNTDQQFHLLTGAAAINAIAGSGVLLEFAQEKVIFDSSTLTIFQQGLVGITAFDGQGVLTTPYQVTDQQGGSQIIVKVTNARLNGVIQMKVVVLGKSFDGTLIYEVLTIGNNITVLSRNHFKEITNLLFQSFLGNLNTAVDGQGSFDVGGRVQIVEASGYYPGRDNVLAQQTIEPNVDFLYFKVANSGKGLQQTLQEALGPSNDIEDLGINITAAKTRTFAQGGSTSIIYGQKFKMKGDNIQKISLLLRLSSGTSFSGTLVIGLRKLQTSATSTSDFLPDDEIGFDPDVESVDEIAVDEADLAIQGVVLSTSPQVVDFVFTNSNISNPQLSQLIEDTYYILTIRRTGSVASGTIVLDEARNSDPDLRLSVFESSIWTDVTDSSLWFKVWGDAVKIASGIAYNNGIRVAAPKTKISASGSIVQSFIEDVDLVDTGEDAENYIILQHTDEFSHEEAHPRTGDAQFARRSDAPLISALSQSNTLDLISSQNNTIVLARVRDRNARSNPQIFGTFGLPALVLGNVAYIINPGAGLLTQNVVGSTFTPNISKPALKYRITSQTTVVDLYGDLNGDGVIDVADQARLVELDGFATDLNGGTVANSTQLAKVLNGDTSIPELLRADVSGNGLVQVANDDGYYLKHFINDGYALPAGSSFTRTILTVEPILNAIASYTLIAASTVKMEVADPDLINNVSFSPRTFQIDFVATWQPENIEVLDLRRYTTTTFLDFPTTALTGTPENGGKNNLFIAGDLFLSNSIKELDGTHHPLDFEKNIIEIEIPGGNTAGEFNIFTNYVLNKMHFSDGTVVGASALNNNQVKFELSISSHVSVDPDGYSYDDGYVKADEVFGVYMSHTSGLLRLNCKNIMYSSTLAEIRSRLQISVNLKKAGFNTGLIEVSATDLLKLLKLLT